MTSSGIEDTHCEAKVKGQGVVTGRYGTIGEVFFVRGDFWPLNTTLYVRDFHGNDPLFVSYLLRTIDFHTHSGKTGVPGVNRNDLHEIEVTLPPTKAEQEAIATILSEMDAESAALEAKLAKASQIKQGMMQELLTGQDSAGMTDVGKPERVTQNRVIKLFHDELGYRYLGDWTDRPDNSNIEEGFLTAYLTKCGYTEAQISRAIYLLRTEADNPSRGLYENNKEVYSLLRYGVPVRIEAGKVTETVHLINWKEPEKNDFAIAEEVTLHGNHERRPDIVLYVNGLAIGVLELKKSSVSIGDGIRQNLSNQEPEFNEWFFSTVQFIFAGNDSEGLQ